MQSQQPLISVIIPTFNSSKTLVACLDSLLTQTFNDFEILIIDGMSTDGTLLVANRYKAKCSNLTVISEPDHGIYDAMNKGIVLAKGEWLYFIGCDDTLNNPKVFEDVVAAIAERDCDVIYGNVLRAHYGGGSYDGAFTYDKLVERNLCHQSIFFKRDIFKKTGMFNLKYKVFADWDHNLKWFFNDSIMHTYVDILIANFSDEGFSSNEKDDVFYKDFHYKLLLRGFSKLEFKTKKRICRIELDKAKANRAFRKLLFYELYLLCIKIHNKLKGFKSSSS